MKITPTGLGATDRYVTVAVEVEIAGSLRFGTIKVPIWWLMSEQVLQALDRKARRDLIAHWSDTPLEEPLF